MDRLPRHVRKNAFTLIELICVLAIIAVVMALIGPAFSTFIAGRNVANAANKIVALARHGRALAISEGRPVRLNVDTTAGTYWLDTQAGGDFKELGTDLGQHFSLPEGVKAEWAADPSAVPISPALGSTTTGSSQLTQPNQPSPTGTSGSLAAAQPVLPGRMTAVGQSVQFYSDGRCEMLKLTLTGTRGGVIELGAPSESEMWRVVQEGQP